MKPSATRTGYRSQHMSESKSTISDASQAVSPSRTGYRSQLLSESMSAISDASQAVSATTTKKKTRRSLSSEDQESGWRQAVQTVRIQLKQEIDDARARISGAQKQLLGQVEDIWQNVSSDLRNIQEQQDSFACIVASTDDSVKNLRKDTQWISEGQKTVDTLRKRVQRIQVEQDNLKDLLNETQRMHSWLKDDAHIIKNTTQAVSDLAASVERVERNLISVEQRVLRTVQGKVSTSKLEDGIKGLKSDFMKLGSQVEVNTDNITILVDTARHLQARADDQKCRDSSSSLTTQEVEIAKLQSQVESQTEGLQAQFLKLEAQAKESDRALEAQLEKLQSQVQSQMDQQTFAKPKNQMEGLQSEIGLQSQRIRDVQRISRLESKFEDLSKMTSTLLKVVRNERKIEHSLEQPEKQHADHIKASLPSWMCTELEGTACLENLEIRMQHIDDYLKEKVSEMTTSVKSWEEVTSFNEGHVKDSMSEVAASVEGLELHMASNESYLQEQLLEVRRELTAAPSMHVKASSSWEQDELWRAMHSQWAKTHEQVSELETDVAQTELRMLSLQERSLAAVKDLSAHEHSCSEKLTEALWCKMEEMHERMVHLGPCGLPASISFPERHSGSDPPVKPRVFKTEEALNDHQQEKGREEEPLSDPQASPERKRQKPVKKKKFETQQTAKKKQMAESAKGIALARASDGMLEISKQDHHDASKQWSSESRLGTATDTELRTGLLKFDADSSNGSHHEEDASVGSKTWMRLQSSKGPTMPLRNSAEVPKIQASDQDDPSFASSLNEIQPAV